MAITQVTQLVGVAGLGVLTAPKADGLWMGPDFRPEPGVGFAAMETFTLVVWVWVALAGLRSGSGWRN
jgi:hypothetical protein